jgi:spore coat protein U domain-containing protein, fimbrial subunit CupE1/2/3/6
MNRSLVVALASASLLGCSVSAWAAQTTTTMNVTLNIGQVQAVVVTAGALNLVPGPNGATGTTATGSATITVRAASGTPYSIGLDGGLHSGATAGARGLMAPGVSAAIGYYLYQGSGGSILWGQNDPYGITQPGTGTGADQAYSVNGATQAYSPGQFPDGTYSDVVTVVVNF